MKSLVFAFATCLVLASYAEEATEKVERVNITRLETGNLVPDITGIDMADGKERKLSDWRGKTVLLIFSGTHCGACRAEHQQIEALAKRWEGKGLVHVTVMADRQAEMAKLLQEHPQGGVVLHSPGGWKAGAFHAFNVHGIPAHVVIAPDGRVAVGDLNGADLERALARHFGEDAPEPVLSPPMSELRLALAGNDAVRLQRALVALRRQDVAPGEFLAVFTRHLAETPRRHQLECLLARNIFIEHGQDWDIPMDLDILFAHAAYDIEGWPVGDSLLSEMQRRWSWQDMYPECHDALRRQPENLLALKRRRAVLIKDSAGAAILIRQALVETRLAVQEAALRELGDLAGDVAARPLRDWLAWQKGADPAQVSASGQSCSLTYDARGTPYEESLELEALIQADESQWFRVRLHLDGARNRWRGEWTPPRQASRLRIKFIDESQRCDARKRELSLSPPSAR